jgi:cobyric acid synthase
MASVRQSIIDAIKTRFESILISGGYQTNIGQKVTEWQAYDSNDRNLECIEFRDTSAKITDPDEEDDNAEAWHYKNLTLQVFVQTAGTTASATVRKMIADVLKAVGTDVTWGGYAIDTALEGDETMIDQETKKIGVSLVTLSIHYKTVKWQD